MSINYAIAFVTVCSGPLFVKSIEFAVPSTIPHLNPKTFIGYAVNYILQTLVVAEIILSCFSLILIFFVSVGHLWIEMKTIHCICDSVGAYEERERLKELTEDEEDLEVIELEHDLINSTELMKVIAPMHIEVIE